MDYDRLREMEWGRVFLGDAPFAQICPACSAFVAVHAPEDGIDPKEHHIRHHRSTDPKETR